MWQAATLKSDDQFYLFAMLIVVRKKFYQHMRDRNLPSDTNHGSKFPKILSNMLEVGISEIQSEIKVLNSYTISLYSWLGIVYKNFWSWKNETCSLLRLYSVSVFVRIVGRCSGKNWKLGEIIPQDC